MSIVAKFLLLIYLLVMVLATILSVVWILTAVFIPEWNPGRTLLMKFQKIKVREINAHNKFRK